MPRRLLVIAGAYCVFGGMAVFHMVVDMVRMPGIHMDFAVFMLPVGIGLMRAKPSSRRWAAFWAVLTIVIVSAATLFAVAGGAGTVAVTPALGGPLKGYGALAYLVGIALAICTLSALTVWVLYTPPVSSVFDATHHHPDDLESPERSAAAGWVEQ